MKTCFVVVLLMFLPPANKNIYLRTFCKGWLASKPPKHYRFPLDDLTVGRPIYFYLKLGPGERHRLRQARKKHRISGVPYDVTGDGICNFKDYAVFANLWKQGKKGD